MNLESVKDPTEWECHRFCDSNLRIYTLDKRLAGVTSTNQNYFYCTRKS